MMLEQWEIEGDTPMDRIRSYIHIQIVNRAKIMRYGCPIGNLATELVRLNHTSQNGANELLSLFRSWLRRQFTQLGRDDDADELAMHLLARSQGVATLANAFHDEAFIRKEVEKMEEWLKTCMENTLSNTQI